MIKRTYGMTILCIALACLLAESGASAQVIDTIPEWDGSYVVSAFGVPNTATFGEAIKAPAGAMSLNSFTFEMWQPTTIAFRGEVYAWNGTMATGPDLFEGTVMSTSGDNTFQPITFSTGGVPVTAGSQYIIFASTAKDQAGHSGVGMWGTLHAASADPNAVGFRSQNDGPDNGFAWTTSSWDSSWGTHSLAFEAAFTGAQSTGTPEPGALTSLAALDIGGGLFLILRRRRAK